VDDRVFLLGLDYLYREAIAEFEVRELLPCACAVAEVLGVRPATGPVEGYYGERPRLTEYFQLMRALQEVPLDRERDVQALPEFRRLLDVTSSPIFGRPEREKLLPSGQDALSQALLDTRPAWTVDRLLEAAYRAALEWDDISLVGLAARTRDPVVLTALRESVVLYALSVVFGRGPAPSVYEWRVDPELAAQAARFIAEFHRFVPGALPAPSAEHAGNYYRACQDNEIHGRCVRIGHDDQGRNYHWAIRRTNGSWALDDFWSPELWTTERYRAHRAADPSAHRQD
jgi:hypothetical protein